MATTELTDDAQTVLRTIAALHDRHQVVTVQAVAIDGRLTYMHAYDLINELFGTGQIRPDLTLTEAGRKAVG